MTRYQGLYLLSFQKHAQGGKHILIRPTVLVERVERVECKKENEALRDFVAFLNTLGSKILLVGFDEDTMAVLRKKIKKFDNGASIYLYTWWKRILKNKRFVFEQYSSVKSSCRSQK